MTDNTESAILAGGCFWGVQELLRHRDGVISTRVGYTGGENENPTTARRSSTPATSSAGWPRTRSPTSRRQACGPARW